MNFDITVTDAEGHECNQTVALSVTGSPCPNWNNITWGVPTLTGFSAVGAALANNAWFILAGANFNGGGNSIGSITGSIAFTGGPCTCQIAVTGFACCAAESPCPPAHACFDNWSVANILVRQDGVDRVNENPFNPPPGGPKTINFNLIAGVASFITITISGVAYGQSLLFNRFVQGTLDLNCTFSNTP